MATPGATDAVLEPGAVPDLRFAVQGAEPVRDAASPTLRFDLRIDARGAVVRSVMLEVQIRIAATQRRYAPEEQLLLAELFGEPHRWGETVRSLLWTQTTLVVPPFQGETTASLYVPCTYDFEVASSKYLAGLSSGEVPLELLFSGTVLHIVGGGAEAGRLQVSRISWNAEAEHRLPVSVWREAVDCHFPHSAWLRLDRVVLDRLVAFKGARALPTFEAALEVLLASPPGPEPEPEAGP